MTACIRCANVGAKLFIINIEIMDRNLTCYTGKLVYCTPNLEKFNILLETETKAEIIKNGCRQTAKPQLHKGYNSWMVAPESLPYVLKDGPVRDKPAVFVLVKDDGVKSTVIVRIA